MSVLQPYCVLWISRFVSLMVNNLPQIHTAPSVFIKNHKNGKSFIDFFVKIVI